jgi:hypothetical protein
MCRKFLNRILMIALVLAILIPGIAMAGGSVHVKGYTRKDGTYVQPHYRSAPDGNFQNNWSTKGNFNPYNGKEGTRINPPAGRSGYPSNYSSGAAAQDWRIPGGQNLRRCCRGVIGFVLIGGKIV